MAQRVFLLTLSLLAIGSAVDLKCGVNLPLEETLKRRSGELETQNDEKGFVVRRNYTHAELLPWVVSFGYFDDAEKKNWNHVCGGTIIAEGFVLTAHQCLKKVGEKAMVRAGDSNVNSTDDDDVVQVVEVVKVYPHPLRGGDSGSAIHDLAVLEVNPKFTITESVRRICLPDQPLVTPDDRQGHSVTVAGYGETLPGPSTGELLSTMVAIRPESYCRKVYESTVVNDVREKNALLAGSASTENKRPEEVLPVSDSSTNADAEIDPRTSIQSDNSRTADVDGQPSPRSRRQTKQRPKATEEEKMKWRENAAALIPETFNSAIMCIGSEISGVGACKGDNGGPGFIFDTGDGLVNEKYVQIAVFSGSVGCGVSSYPDIYVRLEDPETLKFVKSFLRPSE